MTHEARSTKHEARAYALCIGINNYPGTNLDLAGCRNDAEDWADVFKPFVETGRRLCDKAATRDGILAAVRELLGRLDAGDWAFVSFSGHGSWVPDKNSDEPDGRDECIVPYDCRNVILDDEIHTLLQDRPRGSRVFLVSDSCHSGTVYRMMPGERVRMRFMAPHGLLSSVDRRREAERIAHRIRAPRVRIAPGIVHLAGCRDAEYSYDAEYDGRPNGALTYHALESLKALRVPTFTNWIAAIRRRLPSYDYPQTPCLNAGPAERDWEIPFRAA